ncbi:arrestin domain-containing protein 2-like, partial [Hyalella azteca]|uniref:Arrestin domain-containing protein 2-like n=1 Tax=Hyalella azteca TaxID=294128 RepID=A0A8B7P170_HYAAZ
MVKARCTGEKLVMGFRTFLRAKKSIVNKSLLHLLQKSDARFIRSEAWPATIETGTHEFGFEFILPVEAPSSFESPHSYVRYKVKALAKLPSASDKKAETYFSFCQPYDLNRDRAAKEYFNLRKELSWGIRPLKHGPVTLDLQSASK